MAGRLGNTPTICRKCYVHPEIFKSYLSGELILEMKQGVETELRENLPELKPEDHQYFGKLLKEVSSS